MTASQRHKAARIARGLCAHCTRKRVSSRSCRWHLQQDREAKRAWRQAHRRPRRMLSLEEVLEDVRAVAQRLQVRRVSLGLYEREGSYRWSTRLMRRFGLGWPQICAQAGLIAIPYSRGIDRRPCPSCGRVVPWYSPHQRWCHVCRWTVRRRTTLLLWGPEAA